MPYKTDHDFRTDIWKQVVRGLPPELATKAHKYLGKQYQEEKNSMEYDALLSVVQEVMSDYSEWSWNGQRWYEENADDDDD